MGLFENVDAARSSRRSMLSIAHGQSCNAVTKGNALLHPVVCVLISTHAERGFERCGSTQATHSQPA